MFYAHIVLAKKGPLARIWLAAHWDKKLTKAHVFETNIEQSVDGIMQPKVKLALRTSGHLLLGVVRIYSRKAKYLLADCNEAFVKIKMAFRPGMVDLPEGHREANVNAITLPEVFHDFDTALPELNDIDIEAQFSANQSRADEITLREDYGSISMSMHDDGFGDGFDADTPDLVRDAMDSNIDNQLFTEDFKDGIKSNEICIESSENPRLVSECNFVGDGFGDEFGQPDVGLFEGDLFGESAMTAFVEQVTLQSKRCVSVNASSVSEGEVQSPGSESVESRRSSILNVASIVLFNKAQQSPQSYMESFKISHEKKLTKDVEDVVCGKLEREKETLPVGDGVEQSELLQDGEESFALAPIDASAYKGITKAKRKRKLIVDEIKNISGEEMKAQLANTSDIVTTLDLAPPTKRLMYWKETGGVEKLFSLPSRDIPARGLFANYQRHLISRVGLLEDFSVLGPADILTLEQIYQEHELPIIVQGRRGRKRKQALSYDLSGLIPFQSSVLGTGIMDTNGKYFPDVGIIQENVQVCNLALEPETTVITTSFTTPLGSECENKSCQDPVIGISPIEVEKSSLCNKTNDLENMHGADNQDDFHRELTRFHHGGITSNNSSLDYIDSIPNLPLDHVATVLNEAENKTNLDFNEPKAIAINHSANLTSDWIDYDTVAICLEDQQQENETDEQFEERVLNKRAAQMFISVRYRLQKHDTIFLSEIIVGKSRKQAAQKFYSLLVLKKFQALNITQPGPYAEISMTRGPLFDNPKL